MGHIISVVNNKGGVGKSTLTTNLGHALASKGYQVLATDLDNQCNTTNKLTNRTVRAYTLYELLLGEVTVDKIIYQSQYKNLFCLANHPDTSGIELKLIEDQQYFLLYKLLRDYTRDHYDYTILDCPPNLLFFVYSALFLTDFVIVPILSNSTDSLEGLSTVLDKIDDISKNENTNLRFLRLLINNIDRRTNMYKIVVNELMKSLGEDYIFNTSIPTSTKFQQAEYLQKTVLNHAPTSTGAKAYRALANEVEALIPINNEK